MLPEFRSRYVRHIWAGAEQFRERTNDHAKSKKIATQEKGDARSSLYLSCVTFLAGDEETDRLLVVRLLRLQSTPDNSNPRQLEARANSNQNRFPLDFRHTFTVVLPSVTRSLDNSNFFQFPLKVRVIGSRLYFLSSFFHEKKI